MLSYFKSLTDRDTAPVVICDTGHRILYMNPAACLRYERFGGADLVGKNLMDCHGGKARERIEQVLAWFRQAPANDRVHTFYNETENKDVYMIALRDEQGTLIGYYEKHEYRNRDMTPLYCLD